MYWPTKVNRHCTIIFFRFIAFDWTMIPCKDIMFTSWFCLKDYSLFTCPVFLKYQCHYYKLFSISNFSYSKNVHFKMMPITIFLLLSYIIIPSYNSVTWFFSFKQYPLSPTITDEIISKYSTCGILCTIVAYLVLEKRCQNTVSPSFPILITCIILNYQAI